jgi:autotransporter passenger strand-loop-strand repeat protein
MRRRVCSIKVMAIVLVSMLVRTSVSWAVDEHVLSGRERIGGIVAQGDRHVVHSESVVKQTTVRGIQEIHALGTAVRTIILAGGVQRIIGGRAEDTTIQANGLQRISGNGRAEGTIIFGQQDVFGNGRAEGTLILAGGQQDVSGDGRAKDTSIYARGRQTVSASGKAIGTTIRLQGRQWVSDNGRAEGTIIYGQQDVSGNGRAIGTTIKPQGEQHVRGNNSRAEDTTIEANGLQRVSRGRAERTTVNGLQWVFGGRVIQTIIAAGGKQDIYGGGAKDTLIQAGGRQRVCSDGKAKRTTIRLGGKMTADSGSTISGIDNSGLVKLKATDPVMNTIKNYTGHSGSVLKVDALDTAHYPDHPTANYPAATLEGRTVLEDGAEVKLSGLTGTLTMRDEVCSRGGVIKIDVASDLLSGGLVIIDGMVDGLVKLAITIVGAVMNVDEPTTVDDFLRPIYPLYPMIGVRSGISLAMGRRVGEDEHEDTGLVRRRQIVRFNPGADTATARFEFNQLPPNYRVEEKEDGYYLCFRNLKK